MQTYYALSGLKISYGLLPPGCTGGYSHNATFAAFVTDIICIAFV